MSRKRAWSKTKENGEEFHNGSTLGKRQAIIRNEPDRIVQGVSTVAAREDIETLNESTINIHTAYKANGIAGQNNEQDEDDFGEDPFNALADEELEQLSQPTQVQGEVRAIALNSGSRIGEGSRGDDEEFGGLDDFDFNELPEEILEYLSQGTAVEEGTAGAEINNDDGAGIGSFSDERHHIGFEGLGRQTDVKQESGTNCTRTVNTDAYSTPNSSATTMTKLESQPAVGQTTATVKQDEQFEQKKEARKGQVLKFSEVKHWIDLYKHLGIREDGSSIMPLNSNSAVFILGRAPYSKTGAKCSLPTCQMQIRPTTRQGPGQERIDIEWVRYQLHSLSFPN